MISVINSIRPKLSRNVPILAYHRVLDVPDENAYPFDIELVSASVEQFTRQMAVLRKSYHPITFETLLKHLDAGEPPPRGSIIVTFDDGFVDNYRIAFPVLRKLGIPATIFLSTGYIDSQDLFWYEKIAHQVMTTGAKTLRFAGSTPFDIPQDRGRRRAIIADVLQWMKDVPNQVRLDTLADLERQLAPLADWREDSRSGPLTWDQIREMSAGGMEFGSHSVTHPILSKVDPSQVGFELGASKQRIESELQKPVQVIAYPVGGEEAFDENVRTAVALAGYRLAATYISGVQSPDSWDRYALHRLHVERNVDQIAFDATIALPEIFAL